MGELAVTDLGAGPSSTDSPHSSPSSSIIPPVSSTFLYNSMMSVTHGVSPPPLHLEEEVEEEDEEEDVETIEGDICTSFYQSGETRKAREFIPDSKKDDKYWERRRKNNEAAKRSREKRRQNDVLMEQEIAELKHQNEVLMRENAALLRELASLKTNEGGGSLEVSPRPPKPPVLSAHPSNMSPAVSALDLLALQRLLSAFANNSNEVVVRAATNSGSATIAEGMEDSPLDLSGGKIAMLQRNSFTYPSPVSRLILPSVDNGDQTGKLTELAVLTSTSPQTALEGSYSTNRPQSCSWNTTPNPITPPACTGLQALISAAALTASPLLGDRVATTNPAIPSWDLHQSSACLPLGLQPLPQQKLEATNESTGRQNCSIRSPSNQYDEDRYRERRRKNNEAVRRCRENKRARLSMCDEVTGRLQSDNILLRSKLDGLNSEVRALRHLLLAGQQQPLKDEQQESTVEQMSSSIDLKSPSDGAKVKPLPKYALPKKGIPRVPPNNSHLTPLIRRITLPPAFNPVASGIAVPITGPSGAAN